MPKKEITKEGKKSLSDKDFIKINKLILSIEENLTKLKSIVNVNKTESVAYGIDTKSAKDYIEGVFNGRFMIDETGKEYLLPENYASKSKLVAGDILKLVVAPNGTFVFKQIKPVPRVSKVGVLSYASGNYNVTSEDKKYNVLKASVTYYKAKPGDKITIILPEGKTTDWAAVENKI